MAMESQPVSSTAITAVMYDDETQEMQITFAKGGSYLLQGVPAIEVDRLVNASSPGGYWNSFMKGAY